MTREQELERELAAWLAKGPSTAPAAVVDGALEQVARIGQRHWLPARLSTLTELGLPAGVEQARVLRLFVLVLLLALLLAAILVTSLPPGQSHGPFQYEEIGPGVRRLITDGAGHFPSGIYEHEARDIDRLAIDEAGRVVVWTSAHGADNDLGPSCQIWTLGHEGIDVVGEYECARASRLAQMAPDGSTWSLGTDIGGGVVHQMGAGLLQRPSPGDVRVDRFLIGYRAVSIAIAPDGQVWVAVGHGKRDTEGIYVIEADAGIPGWLRPSWLGPTGSEQDRGLPNPS